MQLLRKLAFPFSLLYGAIVFLRNRFYDWGIFTSRTFDTPVICIGNLSAGGTGKTPMTEWLISHLQDTYKVAVLSRGYRRKTKGFVWATAESTPLEIGDEPSQIVQKYPKIVLAVDGNRRRGIQKIISEKKPDLILLDDAFQHRRVKPRFSILLTAYGNLYTDDKYLPAGNLRDHKREAVRADIIIITKCPPDLSTEERETLRAKIGPLPQQELLFSSLQYGSVLKGDSTLSLEELAKMSFTLVTGIAKPEILANYLRDKGITFEHLSYPDHHYFSENEVRMLNEKEAILTTEKDYMRLRGRVQKLCYIKIEHHFNEEDTKRMLAMLKNL